VIKDRIRDGNLQAAILPAQGAQVRPSGTTAPDRGQRQGWWSRTGRRAYRHFGTAGDGQRDVRGRTLTDD
jgi:hypothetical protein